MKKYTLALSALLSMALAAPQVDPQRIIINPETSDLTLQLALDRSTGVRTYSPVYMVGERVRFAVTTNQDAYVYLFNVASNGSISMILPNRYNGSSNFVKAFTTKYVPETSDTYTFNVAPPYGSNKVLGVVSKTPLNTDSVALFRNAEYAEVLAKGDLDLANRLSYVLNNLPNNTWTAETISYTVAGNNNAGSVVNFPSTPSTLPNTSAISYPTNTTTLVPAPSAIAVIPTSPNVVNFPTVSTIPTTPNNNTVVNFANNNVPSSAGVLIMSSTPSGATVYLDDRAVGTTPLQLTNIPMGNHTVRFNMAGFSDFSSTVYVSPNSSSTIDINLQKSTAATNTNSVWSPPPISNVPSSYTVPTTNTNTGFIPISSFSNFGGYNTASNTTSTNTATPTTFGGAYGYTIPSNTGFGTFGNASGSSFSAINPNTSMSSYNTGYTTGGVPFPNNAGSYSPTNFSGASSNTYYPTNFTDTGTPNSTTNTLIQQPITYIDPSGSTIVTSSSVLAGPAQNLLYVLSTPSNASVSINNQMMGKTPITINNIPTGTHSIKVSLTGYNDYSGTVNIEANTSSRLDVGFKQETFQSNNTVSFGSGTSSNNQQQTQQRYNITITSNVEGALVTINNQTMGYVAGSGLNMTLAAGQYDITVSAQGYTPATYRFTVANNMTLNAVLGR